MNRFNMRNICFLTGRKERYYWIAGAGTTILNFVIITFVCDLRFGTFWN